jgi:hypothetical protein
MNGYLGLKSKSKSNSKSNSKNNSKCFDAECAK